MSFAQLAIREAAINQSLLLAPLLADIPEEIEEEPQLPAIVTPPSRSTFITSDSTALITQSVDTNIILPGGEFEITSATTGNITSSYIRNIPTNRWYMVQTSATNVPTNATTLRVMTSTNSTATTIMTPYFTPTTSTTSSIIYDGTGTYTNICSGQVIYTNTYLTEVDCNIHNPNVQRRRDFGVKKLIKGSIKRALKLLDNFGMEEDTKIFLNGEAIEVSHPDSIFKFVIHKDKYNKVSAGITNAIYSTPFKLSLFTKSNIHVADLCVYAENTPMLDQLFMVAMYVKSGNEEDLLRKANYRALCQDKETKEIIVLEHPYMKQKLLSR